MTFEQVFQLLMLAVGVLVFWWSHRSFPPQQTAKLIEQLTEASQQTQTQLDDMLVEVARLLNDLRMAETSSTSPHPPVPLHNNEDDGKSPRKLN